MTEDYRVTDVALLAVEVAKLREENQLLQRMLVARDGLIEGGEEAAARVFERLHSLGIALAQAGFNGFRDWAISKGDFALLKQTMERVARYDPQPFGASVTETSAYLHMSFGRVLITIMDVPDGTIFDAVAPIQAPVTEVFRTPIRDGLNGIVARTYRVVSADRASFEAA